MKKKQIHMREVELHVLGSLNESNAETLDSALDSYRAMVFPGTKNVKSKEEEQMEAAKRALAEEAKKVLLIKPIDKDAMFRKMRKAKEEGRQETNAAYGQLAGRAFAEHERQRMQILHRQQRGEKVQEARQERRKKRENMPPRKPKGKR